MIGTSPAKAAKTFFVERETVYKLTHMFPRINAASPADAQAEQKNPVSSPSPVPHCTKTAQKMAMAKRMVKTLRTTAFTGFTRFHSPIPFTFAICRIRSLSAWTS